MDIFSTRRARLKLLIDQATGGNISLFAGSYGYSRAQLSQYLSPTYNHGRSLGEAAARKLESRLALAQGWLDKDEAPNAETQPSSGLKLDLPKADQPGSEGWSPDRVPYIGTVLTREGGVVEIRDVVPEGTQKYIPAQGGKGAFAVSIKGSDLRPRIKNGEYIVAHPREIALPGDDVLLKLTSGAHMILQFLYGRKKEMTFGSVNEEGPAATFLETEIESMSVIAGICHPLD